MRFSYIHHSYFKSVIIDVFHPKKVFSSKNITNSALKIVLSKKVKIVELNKSLSKISIKWDSIEVMFYYSIFDFYVPIVKFCKMKRI
jgi:hypothetical protein